MNPFVILLGGRDALLARETFLTYIYIYMSRLRTFFAVFFNLFQRGVSQIIVRNYKVYTNGFFAFASGNEDGEQLALCRYAVKQMMHDKKGVKTKEN